MAWDHDGAGAKRSSARGFMSTRPGPIGSYFGGKRAAQLRAEVASRGPSRRLDLDPRECPGTQHEKAGREEREHPEILDRPELCQTDQRTSQSIDPVRDSTADDGDATQ